VLIILDNDASLASYEGTATYSCAHVLHPVPQRTAPQKCHRLETVNKVRSSIQETATVGSAVKMLYVPAEAHRAQYCVSSAHQATMQWTLN